MALCRAIAIIVRENFPANEIGTRVGVTLTSTLVGMAIGGWLSGVVFDLTGSYTAAFLNGVAWNMAEPGYRVPASDTAKDTQAKGDDRGVRAGLIARDGKALRGRIDPTIMVATSRKKAVC